MKRDANALTKAVVWGMFLCCASMPSYAQQAAPQEPAQHPQYSELPAGAGKDTLIRVCSKCHSPDNVIANGQDRTGWENTITKMAGFGAVGPTKNLPRSWTTWKRTSPRQPPSM